MGVPNYSVTADRAGKLKLALALLGSEDLFDEEAGSGVEAVAVGALDDREDLLGALQVELGPLRRAGR